MYLLRSKTGHSDQRDDSSSTVSTSQQDTYALRKEVADLKHELKVKKAKISSQQQMLRELGGMEERWTRKIEGLKEFIDISMRDSATDRYYLLANEHGLLRREQNALQVAFSKSEAELVETKAELDETRQSQISATESLRKVQEMAFQLQDPQEWAPESYETISRNLDRLHGDASKWCKDHGRQTDYFDHCMSFFRSHDWLDTMRYDPGIFSTARNLPRLILEATLMNYIYEEIFANPFFFLRWRLQMNTTEGNDDLARVPDFCMSLEETLREVTRGDMTGGNLWRSQFLRLLCPKPRGDEKEISWLTQTKALTAEARSQAANHFMDHFLDSSIRQLIVPSESEEEALASLRDIFMTATELSYSLWQRKSSIVVVTMKDLPLYFDHETDLGLGKPIFEAHRMHNRELDDNPTCLNGKTIRIVTHPAVVVRGLSDGSDYSQASLWKAAVVWMG